MVILLNQGNRTISECVFWYRPDMVNNSIKLCHPSVWEYTVDRFDESKLDNLALLSCYSADE